MAYTNSPAPKLWQEKKQDMKKLGVNVDAFKDDFVNHLVAANKSWDEYQNLFARRDTTNPKQLETTWGSARGAITKAAKIGAEYEIRVRSLIPKATQPQKKAVTEAAGTLLVLTNILNERVARLDEIKNGVPPREKPPTKEELEAEKNRKILKIKPRAGAQPREQ